MEVNKLAFKEWYKHLRAWEGDLRDAPENVDLDDIPTKCGIRWPTFKACAKAIWGLEDMNRLGEMFRNMTDEEHEAIAYYLWKQAYAHRVESPRIAACLAEAEWGTGHSRSVQQGANALGANLVVDGRTGRMTLRALNELSAKDEQALFEAICKAHGDHYINLCAKGRGHIKYLKGWLARHYIGYDSLNQQGFYQRFSKFML